MCHEFPWLSMDNELPLWPLLSYLQRIDWKEVPSYKTNSGSCSSNDSGRVNRTEDIQKILLIGKFDINGVCWCRRKEVTCLRDLGLQFSTGPYDGMLFVVYVMYTLSNLHRVSVIRLTFFRLEFFSDDIPRWN